ncbi:ferrous iron transport protein B [Clostridium thermosuccinogenes]|jgi:ferrous iron transport protein B|uniref:ferrous iron transport protein B n=1 Tax=Clostridium thermosuccinogenes TaxID=84032 RepID=UPI000CCC6C31|nr:ferrous iron transport protein B [Pseudoclostridium thermosuccinogenes]PNT93557.1 ferrous iron transport protein B [Pseudoclostridium thermosuccinogenes]
MQYRFALVGNPNCGKTTMFNEITGSTQYVGNWPGVTIEKKEGKARKFKEDIRIIDLPGIYSLSPYSMEEIIARDYIIDEKPDVIINILDATNIERNLYLTTQVIELGIPVVVVLNIMDEVESRGDSIDTKELEKFLGTPVLCTSANKGKGVSDVVQKALELAQTAAVKAANERVCIFDEKIEKCITEVEGKISSYLKEKHYSRWAAIKLLEGDEKAKEKLNIPSELLTEIDEYKDRLEKEYDNDMETMVADNRYRFISHIVGKTVKKKSGRGELTLSDKIDRVVTNKFLAIPLFLAVMFAVFQVTFGAIGSFTIDWVDALINDSLAGLVSGWLEAAGASEWLHELIVGGIIGGMGSMLVFVPQIMILFFFISLLEDSGYMARAAFVMDRLLRKFGLSGKSFIPMFMGFGCTTPAVMATRTLENEKDRKLTIMLTPFMSCGARLPVYVLFAAAFFAKNQSIVIFSIYVLGIVVAVLSGIILKNTILKGDAEPFVMELPPYRIPTLKGISIHMWDRGKAFIKKAGTVIFAASVVIWFLQSFSFNLQMVEDPADSIFGYIGKAIAPLFAPLGFGDWKSSVALLTGLVAKEVVVATMGILHGIGEVAEDSVELAAALQASFTPLKAYAFMAFTLLYVPCVAAFAAIKREMNSWKWTLMAVGYQTGVAWIVAFIIYQGGRLLGLN